MLHEKNEEEKKRVRPAGGLKKVHDRKIDAQEENVTKTKRMETFK